MFVNELLTQDTSSPLKYSEIQQKSCKNRLKNEFVSPVFEYFNGLLDGRFISRLPVGLYADLSILAS